MTTSGVRRAVFRTTRQDCSHSGARHQDPKTHRCAICLRGRRGRWTRVRSGPEACHHKKALGETTPRLSLRNPGRCVCVCHGRGLEVAQVCVAPRPPQPVADTRLLAQRRLYNSRLVRASIAQRPCPSTVCRSPITSDKLRGLSTASFAFAAAEATTSCYGLSSSRPPRACATDGPFVASLTSAYTADSHRAPAKQLNAPHRPRMRIKLAPAG